MVLDPTSHYRWQLTQCIRDLNLRAKTINLLEEDLRVSLHDLGSGRGFLAMTPKTHATKEKIGHLGLIKF